jgi:hypothetical protein
MWVDGIIQGWVTALGNTLSIPRSTNRQLIWLTLALAARRICAITDILYSHYSALTSDHDFELLNRGIIAHAVFSNRPRLYHSAQARQCLFGELHRTGIELLSARFGILLFARKRREIHRCANLACDHLSYLAKWILAARRDPRTVRPQRGLFFIAESKEYKDQRKKGATPAVP